MPRCGSGGRGSGGRQSVLEATKCSPSCRCSLRLLRCRSRPLPLEFSSMSLMWAGAEICSVGRENRFSAGLRVLAPAARLLCPCLSAQQAYIYCCCVVCSGAHDWEHVSRYCARRFRLRKVAGNAEPRFFVFLIQDCRSKVCTGPRGSGHRPCVCMITSFGLKFGLFQCTRGLTRAS